MRASESDRAVACPASLVLIRSARAPSERRDRAAAWGTLCHHWAETGETDPAWADPRDTKCLEKKLVLSGVRREVYWTGGVHEVTFAINLTANEFPPIVLRYEMMRNGLAEYPTRDEWKAAFPAGEWLTGTIDYLEPDNLDDLKTGRWPVDPATSKQLRSYALLPWIEAGMPIKWDIPVTITQWERYPLDGLPVRTTYILTGVDLLDHLEDLRWAAAHPEEVNATDDGCRFCACKPNCPAWTDDDDKQTRVEMISDD